MKLVLGTVQFGLPYGITNTNGQPSLDDSFAVLDAAWESGVTILDSAQLYGEANTIIANYHASRPHRFKIINKVLRYRENLESVYAYLERERERLLIDQFECVMFHSPESIDNRVSDDFFMKLSALGLSKKSGVSFDDPKELLSLQERFSFDVVQLPSNPINLHFMPDDFMSALAASGIDVHVRSAFLQGLLISGLEPPPYLQRLSIFINKMSEDVRSHGLTMISACLLYHLQKHSIGHIVVGAQNITQWKEILAAYQLACEAKDNISLPWASYACPNYELVHPLEWIRLKAESV
ncbi:MAG: aldo/keto reductase [Micavibrio sp.]